MMTSDTMTVETFTGSNNPPSALEDGVSFYKDLSAFLADHPAIANQEDAQAAKLWLDRSAATLKAIEAERDGKVRPLNTEVKRINGVYKAGADPLDKLVSVLKSRIAAFLNAEENRRRAIEAEAKRKRDEAERIALAKIKAEEEAKANADAGEVIDLGETIADTDAAIDEARRAANLARTAERDADNTRIGGGFSRAVGLRTVEKWSVTDAIGALLEMGATPGIEDEIVKAARAYRKLHGKLPNGVSVTEERVL